MKERLRQISRNQFLRNVSTLAFGTIISQAVVVGSSPVLARLFSVEAFGILSVFTSITVFFAVASTGRYELALGLPEDDLKAKRIFKLIISIGAGISLFYLLLIFLLRNVFSYRDDAGFLEHTTSLLAPLYIFFVALYSALGYWFQRKKRYKDITVANAVQVVTATIFSLVFGFLKIWDGMIYALIIGIIFSAVYLLLKDSSLHNLSSYGGSVIPVAKEYSSFPRYMIFSDLSLTASQQFIPILFSVLYSTTIVGFFAMANRMLRLPNIVITTSIGNVFRNDAIDEIREKGNCEALYRSTFKKLIFMALPIYLIIFIAAPTLFVLIFGEKWELAGYFARILSTMLFLEFIATPLNTLFYIREKQKILMRIQVLNAISGAIMIFLGYYFFKSASYSLVFFCINAIIFNSVFLLMTYRISKS